ncbi:MAG: leucine-rich repeat domain-containing protein [Prevotella sp.]|nr:leucine-rich repeat domain-containing protein [Prevotella sp.]
MFANCSSLKKLLIPNSVTMVGSEAFKNCSALKSLDLPKSINRLGYSVFAGCKLNSLYIRGVIDSHWMSSSIFTDMDTQTELYVLSSEMEKFQAIYKGPIYPLPQMSNDVMINETTFPDEIFRKWVLSQEYGADGILTNEELDHVTSIDISRLGIQYLMGIEYFTALKELNCMTNNLSMLNLSNNIALEKLLCDGNELMSLNLLKNKELKYLNCVANNLTSIDVSGCTELDTLACSGNQLTILDVSKNTKLICLECYSNQLKSLDLSKNTALRRVHCNKNQLTTLDVSKNTALTLLVCSNNLLTTLDVTKNSALTNLTCMDNKLTTLYVSDNKSLKELSCFNNQLTSLDVSGCSALKTLGCRNNQLATLNLSGCSALDYVDCHSNQLETLDLSENTALTTLFCFQNKIKGIGMDALVESLPTVSEGSLNVMYVNNEQNVMTTTQVAAAKAKGWTPYIWEYSISEEYAGTEAPEMAYRPMIEDDKVWKVGSAIGISDDIVKMVDYYYFDGDTIINGKTCKQMMFQRYVSPDYLDYDQSKQPSLDYVGAWYEEDKKVYLYYKGQQSMRMMYDFSLDANTSLLINNDLYLVGTRQTEGLEGFKGIYRDVMFCANEDQNTHITFWLEGVGGIMGPGVNAFNPILVDPQPQFLMSCTVGDEVIYLNDEYEDGATPMDAEAKKHRFDFTHTIKTKPKARTREDNAETLYGEYNNLLLGINLNPLDDTYLVRITNESDQVVYEKTINAGSIVGLNIDISAFAKGRYTVTMENSSEVFTGEFETITTGIKELKNSRIEKLKSIYNLQGQRLNRLQKGLNIVNGRKVFVK